MLSQLDDLYNYYLNNTKLFNYKILQYFKI